MELLDKLYNDELTGFQSADKLYKKAKKIDSKITLKQVREYLSNNATAQITKEVKRTKTFNSIISPSVHNNYQMDIMNLPNPSLNGNYKYLLTMIDIYSRYAFVKPLKTKSGPVVFEAFKSLIAEFGKCKNINCDLGSEFIYKPFVDYCKDNDITIWYSNPEQDNKNAIIERFHRTIRNIILKYTVAKGKGYIKVLPKLIQNYNNTEHNTVKAEPTEIWKGEKKNEQHIERVEDTFNEGDKVRHIIDKSTFDKKSSTASYTKTIYTITKKDGHSYYLDELKKPFKSFQLVNAVGEEINKEYDNNATEESKRARIARRLRKEGTADYLNAGKYYE
jgi:transposase InsO family protein